MNFEDIYRLLAQGKKFEVVFTRKIEELETLFDDNCKATLLGTDQIQRYDDGSICAGFIFDFSKYEESNKAFYKPNYYDKQHVPCLYVYETSYYPTKPVESIWFMFDTDTSEYFTIIEGE